MPHLLETLGGKARRFPILTGAHPSEGPLDPLATVVSHVIVEPRREILQTDALPVPTAEELVLEPAEEPLHGRVVRRAPLPRHRALEAVPFADLEPPGSPAAAPPVAGLATPVGTDFSEGQARRSELDRAHVA